MQISHPLQPLLMSQLLSPKKPSLMAEADLLGWEVLSEKMVLLVEVEVTSLNAAMS
jgi:hypothetical protein